MAQAQEATARATTKPASVAKTVPVDVVQTVFRVNAGRKDARKDWTGELTVDIQDLPAGILTQVIGIGLLYHLKQAANSVNPKGESDLAKKVAAMSQAEQEAMALKLMGDRWEAMKNGDLGKSLNVRGGVERRAYENAKAAIKAAAVAAGRGNVADEKLSAAADALLADPVKGPAYVKEAQRQLDEERTRATSAAGALTADVLALLG